MSEGLPKPHQPSEEERERARMAHEAADPTTYSQLSPDFLVPTGEHTRAYHRSIATDGADRFAPLPKNPERQQVVARLLKGIVNVADVVEGPGCERYSKMLPHERIEAAHTPDEIRADVQLLYLVFGDFDHRYVSDMEMHDIEHSNLRVEAGRASYYDFEQAEIGSLPTGMKGLGVTQGALAILMEKLETLKAHLAGEEGLAFIASVASAAGKPLPELFPYTDGTESPERFQEMLLRRIDHARFLVRQELAEFKEAA